jgi:glycolate oxidase FAD binding subunit
VVKNVAGYDLCKLFVGSCGTLGVMVEASFKVLPVPEAEQIVAAPCESLAHAAVLLEQIQQSELTPVVLDLTSVAASRHCSVVLALAGTREEVDWQLGKAVGLGLSTVSDLEYERSFWSATEAAPPHRISVLPSRLTEVLQNLEAFHFVARAGNGVVYYRGGKAPPEPELPRALMQRIKETYDPKRVFSSLRDG